MLGDVCKEIGERWVDEWALIVPREVFDPER